MEVNSEYGFKNKMQSKYFFFPFGEIKSGSKIIIYGAGKMGRLHANLVKSLKYCDILFVADRNYLEIKDFPFNISIKPPRDILTADYDYVLIANMDDVISKNILQDLENMGIPKNKIVKSKKYELEDELFASPYTSYGGKLYSQHGDDVIVFQIFKQLGMDKPSYLDVGANDPLYLSNTAIFTKLGSRGINIEANPALINNFYEQRPNDINLNIGVGTKKGILPFYMFDESSGCNTFSLKEAKHFEESFPELKIIKTIELPVTTLTDIINEHWNGKYPDFIDIDIEGLDYEVLKSCDFSGETPYVILVEIDKADVSEMNEMLAEKGFVPYCRMISNMIYVRKNIRNELLGVN
jgi:FkbM family methyltransferase